MISIALNNILLNSDMSRTELSHILEISPPAILKLSKITREKSCFRNKRNYASKRW